RVRPLLSFRGPQSLDAPASWEEGSLRSPCRDCARRWRSLSSVADAVPIYCHRLDQSEDALARRDAERTDRLARNARDERRAADIELHVDAGALPVADGRYRP